MKNTYKLASLLPLRESSLSNTGNVDGSCQRQNHGTIQFLGVVWDENNALGFHDDARQLRLHFPAAEAHDQMKSSTLDTRPSQTHTHITTIINNNHHPMAIFLWTRVSQFPFGFLPPHLPSVLWCCWLAGKKGIWPLKTEWWGTGVVICLQRGANDLHIVQLMLLPPPWSLASLKSRLA